VSGVCVSRRRRGVQCVGRQGQAVRDECLILKMKALHFYEKLVTTHATAQCLVLGDLFVPHRHCENLKSKCIFHRW
jgi:hypothetical protein